MKRFSIFALCIFAIIVARTSVRAEERTSDVNSAPQQTTATFGDWVVRCQLPGDGKKVCEVAQSLVLKGQNAPTAEIAIGRLKDRDTITIVIPANVSFDKKLTIEAEKFHLELTYARCVPGACFAVSPIDLASLLAQPQKSKNVRLSFSDAGEHVIGLPFSLQGLPQAIAHLRKELGS